MPRRPVAPVLTVEQLRGELTALLERAQQLSSDRTLTNGQFRYRLKRLERRLEQVLERLGTPRRPTTAGLFGAR